MLSNLSVVIQLDEPEQSARDYHSHQGDIEKKKKEKEKEERKG